MVGVSKKGTLVQRLANTVCFYLAHYGVGDKIPSLEIKKIDNTWPYCNFQQFSLKKLKMDKFHVTHHTIEIKFINQVLMNILMVLLFFIKKYIFYE